MKTKMILIAAFIALAASVICLTDDVSSDSYEETLYYVDNVGTVTEVGEYTPNTFTSYYHGSFGYDYLYYNNGPIGIEYANTEGTTKTIEFYHAPRFFGSTFVADPTGDLYHLTPSGCELFTGFPGGADSVRGISSYMVDITIYTAVLYKSGDNLAVAFYQSQNITDEATLIGYTVSSIGYTIGQEYEIKCLGPYAILYDPGNYLYYVDSTSTVRLGTTSDKNFSSWDACRISDGFAYAMGSAPSNTVKIRSFNTTTQVDNDLNISFSSVGGFVSDLDAVPDGSNYYMIIKTAANTYQPTCYNVSRGSAVLFDSNLTAMPGSFAYSVIQYANKYRAHGMIDQDGNFKIAKFVNGSPTVSSISDVANLGNVQRVFGYGGYYMFYTVEIPTETYQVSFTVNESVYGSVQPSGQYSVAPGTVITTNGATLSFAGNTVTAVPSSSPPGTITYSFVSWSVPSGTVVNGDIQIMATFDRTATPYTITWIIDGVSSTTTVEYGEDPVHDIPTKPGYTFAGWSPALQRVTGPATYTATWSGATTHNIYIVSNNTEYGTVDIGFIPDVPTSTEIFTDGNHLTIGDTVVTATPAPATAQYTYYLSSWPIERDPVTGDITITATFQRTGTSYTITWIIDGVSSTTSVEYGATPTHETPIKTGYLFNGWSPEIVPVTADATYTATWLAISDDVTWSNNLYNYKISIAMCLQSTSYVNHTMTIPLSKYDGVDPTTQKSIWTYSGYSLKLQFSHDTTNLRGEVTIWHGGQSLGALYTADFGNWRDCIVHIDLEKGVISVDTVKFQRDNIGINFFRYETFSSEVLCDYGSTTVLDGYTTDKIHHMGTVTKMTVIDTSVFFDSYKIVMNNPTINIDQAFPSYSGARLSFYSFAVFGTGFTINGTTFGVSHDGKVTVSYVTDSDGNKLLPAEIPSQTPRSKTMTMSNIYVSWDDLTHHVSLTFVDDRFTIDLGQYSSKTISFAGVWWFTSEIWSSSTTTQKTLGGWKTFPDLSVNQIVLLFLGSLLLIGSAAYIATRQSSGLVDIIIITVAAVVALLLLKV